MKIAPRQVDSLLKSPHDGTYRAILIYGPDQGLVRERAMTYALKIVSDINDPFNAAHLNGDILSQDPARFFDEVEAQSLMGGQRLVRITNVDNKFGAILKDWLKSSAASSAPSPAIVVIEGGDLRPRDALRKICEDDPHAAAIACYIQDERDMATFLKSIFADYNRAIAPDAIEFLAYNLKGDRGRARSEAEKLDLYKGTDPGPITLGDAMAACGEGRAESMDDLIYAVFGRNPHKAVISYSRLIDEDTEIIAILRSLQNHVKRLLDVRTKLDENHHGTLDSIIDSLHPPIFFKVKESFRAQIGRYNAPFLRRLLMRLNELEADTKKSGTTPETLVADAILKLASF
ncbi:MAG: DNA polymerase III subunit delta [Alphaproteobacteria bacterium]|nr:DNA polymerase III subunit delta [Alphaproteobacteria bacterium]